MTLGEALARGMAVPTSPGIANTETIGGAAKRTACSRIVD